MVSYKSFASYGAKACSGFYSALLTPPGAKPYITNESRLEHGTEVIIPKGSAKVSQREFSVTIFIEGSDIDDYLQKYREFINDIRDGEISLKVERLNRIFHIVYTQCSQYGSYGDKRGKFVLKFIEYNPDNREIIYNDRP